MTGDGDYLRHILAAIERIERYTSVGREIFWLSKSSGGLFEG